MRHRPGYFDMRRQLGRAPTMAEYRAAIETAAAEERARGHQDALNGVKPQGRSRDYIAGYRAGQA